MGKYIRKSGTKGEIAAMEVSQALGVRTRARTLALQRLQNLELRSRRLEKPPILAIGGNSKRQKQPQNRNSRTGSRLNSGSDSMNGNDETEDLAGEEKENGADLGIEASLGENVLDFEVIERSIRESTPSSLIRDPDVIRTPGSTTRPTSSKDTSKRMQRHIPTKQEIDEFFAGAQEEELKLFTEKYNFDPVNEMPLTGKFQWVKVEPEQ